MSTKISIAMCSYNGAKFINEQLVSLSLQTLLPHELIICDDISMDTTVDLIEQFKGVSPFPVHIIQNKERLGYRRNFMQAASMCSGDLVAFCDQDDIWHSDKLEQVAREFSDPSVSMVHHNARLIDAQGKVFGRVNDSTAHPSVALPLSENPWHYSLGFTQTYRKEIKNLGRLRESIMGEKEIEWTAHDQWISFISSALGKVVYLDRDLVDYRQHGSNTYGHTIDKNKMKFFGTILGKLTAYRDYRILATVSRRRKSVLEAVVDDSTLSSNYRALAESAVDFYDRMSDMYELRAAVYASSTVRKRFRSWLTMIKRGFYRKSALVSFRSVSILRDLLLGVILAKLKNGTASTADFSLQLGTRK